MKMSLCLTLLALSWGAAARSPEAPGALEHAFVKDAGASGNQQFEEVVTPLGTIEGIRPDEWSTFNVNGLQLTAKMGDHIRQTVAFDKYGTAYLYYQRLGEHAIVRISKEGAAAEGYFEVDGRPYIISQGQVYGLNDSRLKEFVSHLGRLDRQHLGVIAKGAALGVATLITGMLASYVGMPHAVAPAVLAAFAAGTYYGWLRRDRFKMTQMELGFAGNRFSKKIRGLERVLEYKKTLSGDVEVKVAVPGGETKTISMRSLMMNGTLRYTHADCVVALTRIRELNVGKAARDAVGRLIPIQ